MSPEAQRIAIAEACGWKYNIERGGYMRHDPMDSRVLVCRPDYLADLNAIHEAEKAVLFGKVGWVHYSHALLKDNIHATAAQRAEAFLRTLGKWIY